MFRWRGLGNRKWQVVLWFTDRFDFKNLVHGSMTLYILFGPSIYRSMWHSGREVMRLVQISPTSNDQVLSLSTPQVLGDRRT